MSGGRCHFVELVTDVPFLEDFLRSQGEEALERVRRKLGCGGVHHRLAGPQPDDAWKKLPANSRLWMLITRVRPPSAQRSVSNSTVSRARAGSTLETGSSARIASGILEQGPGNRDPLALPAAQGVGPGE